MINMKLVVFVSAILVACTACLTVSASPTKTTVRGNRNSPASNDVISSAVKDNRQTEQLNKIEHDIRKLLSFYDPAVCAPEREDAFKKATRGRKIKCDVNNPCNSDMYCHEGQCVKDGHCLMMDDCYDGNNIAWSAGRRARTLCTTAGVTPRAKNTVRIA